MSTGVSRALFWVAALAVAPLVGFLTSLDVSARNSDLLALLLLLGLPPALTFVLGRALGIRGREWVVAAATATGLAVLYVLVYLWYLFEVVGVS